VVVKKIKKQIFYRFLALIFEICVCLSLQSDFLLLVVKSCPNFFQTLPYACHTLQIAVGHFESTESKSKVMASFFN
jgi:hypothetical protein